MIPRNARSYYIDDSDSVKEQNAKIDFNVYVKFVAHSFRYLHLHPTGRTSGYLLQIATFTCISFYKVNIYKNIYVYIDTHIYLFQ